MEKLLFICGNISRNSSQGIRYSNLLPFFVKKFKVYIISYNNFYEEKVAKNLFLRDHSKIKNEIYSKNINLIAILKRLYKKVAQPLIFPDKYKFFLNEYKIKIDYLIKKEQIDKVIIGLTPFSLYKLAEYINMNYPHVNIIVDLSDPFYFNIFKTYSFLHSKKKIKNYEERMLRSVDKLVVLNPIIKKIYQSEFKIDNIYVIEQGVQKKNHSNYCKCDKDNESFKLIYAGGLYKNFREGGELFKAINKLSNCFLVIYGNIKQELLPKNLSNIEYQGAISNRILLKKYSEFDAIVFIDNKNGYQVPGKLLEILQINKPILFIYSNVNSPTFNYIFHDDASIIKVKNNQNEILNGIKKLKEIDVYKIDRTKIIKDYYWNNLAKKYIEIIND